MVDFQEAWDLVIMIAMSRVFRSRVENNYSITSECFLNDKLVLTSA